MALSKIIASRHNRRTTLIPFPGTVDDGSTLSLDFTTGVLDPRLTFTRASGGTYVGNDGFVYGVDFATSSSLAIGTGSKSVTLTATAGASRRYEIGQTVYIANGANNMSGAVTAYSPSTQVLTINATSTSGSGSFTSWIVGNASARFDYDPSTLQPRGLLIEGSANNLVKYSQDLNQVSGVNQWYGAAFNTPTVPGSPPTDPFGGTTSSWKLVATAGSAYHIWRFAATYTAADYTFSFWARAAEYDRIVLSDGGTGRGGCRFVLTGNGTATVIAGVVTPTNPRITPYPGGWYRCEVTMTMTAAVYGIGIAGYPSATTPDAFGASYNADGTSGVFATAVQAELGSGASSYIPTGASTGNRANESLYLDGASFAAFWPSGQSQYSVYFAGDITRSPATTQFLWLARTGSGGVGASRARSFVTSASSIRANTTVNDLVSGLNASTNTLVRTALGVSSGSCALSTNNGTTSAIVTNADTGLSTDAAQLVFNPNSDVFQHIKTLKYWPTRLSDAQLQALTT